MNFSNILYLSGRIADQLKQRFFPKPVVLGRNACLGKEIFELLNQKEHKYWLINQQKTRVDLFLQWIAGATRPSAKAVKPFMARLDVYPYIKEQERLTWLQKTYRPSLIILDSYSELTDQQFRHRQEGWSFCCHYTDLHHSPEFEAQFESLGLLPVERLEMAYRQFFSWLDQTYPGTEILFIHYPTKLDSREKFKLRAAEILRVIRQLAADRNNLRNIKLEDSQVDWHETDNSPYHYSSATNQAFAFKCKEFAKNI